MVRARLMLHLLARQEIQLYQKVYGSNLTVPNNVKTPSNAITSKLAEIDQHGSQEHLWMALRPIITGASVEHPRKAKRNMKDWIATEIGVLRPEARNCTA